MEGSEEESSVNLPDEHIKKLLDEEEKEVLELKRKIKTILRRNPSLQVDPLDHYKLLLDNLSLEELRAAEENLQSDVLNGTALNSVEEGLLRSYALGIQTATGVDITQDLLTDPEFKVAMRETAGSWLSGFASPWVTLLMRSAMLMARGWDRHQVSHSHGNGGNSTPPSQSPLPADG